MFTAPQKQIDGAFVATLVACLFLGGFNLKFDKRERSRLKYQKTTISIVVPADTSRRVRPDS